MQTGVGLTTQGLILAAIFNVCRQNTRVPSAWIHTTVTLIHKDGDTETIRNWHPICLQLTLYKLYSVMLAHRIARGGFRGGGGGSRGSGPPLSYMKNDVMHTVIYTAFCMLASLDLQDFTSF